MNVRKTMILFVIIAFSSILHAADLAYTGATPISAISTEKFSSIEPIDLNGNRQQISYLLKLESGVRTVGEAINLKTQGLNYVQDAYDFEYLTSYPFQNPSDAYKNAVGEFIAKNIASFVRSNYDLRPLQILEARTLTVGQAMAVKSAGLRVHLTINDFIKLIQPSFANPSDAYKTAISRFTAQNIRYALDAYTSIYMILEVEKSTMVVGDSMAVKNSGLIAVRTQRDLFDLARYSVSNPSAAYQQAVNEFLRINLPRYPQN